VVACGLDALASRPRQDNDSYTPSADPKGSMQAAFLVRNNIRHRRDIEDAYLGAIEQAQSEIILPTPTFYPD
jgi:cardiolipin synthase